MITAAADYGLWGLVILGSSATSLSLTKAHLLEPLRHALRPKAPWLAKGLGCPWCMSHWLVGFGTWMVWPWFHWLTWLIYTMAGVALSGLVMGLLIQLLMLGQSEFNALHDELTATKKALADVIAEVERSAHGDHH